MATLREMAQRPEKFAGGHRLCAGCGHSVVVRMVLGATPDPIVVSAATGCLEVASVLYPYSSWETAFIHAGFENAAATLSGVEAAYQTLRRQGRVNRDMKFIAFAGDGGTYDIGLQSLSGAMERGHHLLYVCLNNEGYMNTGIQRSSATPKGTETSTTPAGRVIPGKPQPRKDITEIMAAHDLPYVAQASPSHWRDLEAKAAKALKIKGPTFINTLSPCPRGWRSDVSDTIELTRLAVDTCYWPLYEVEDGKYRLNHRPKEKKPFHLWLERQGRFHHLFKPENEPIVAELQGEIDRHWEMLLRRCGES